MKRTDEPAFFDVYQRIKHRRFRIWPARSLVQIWLTGLGWSDLNADSARSYLAEETVVDHDHFLRWLERRWLDKEI